MNVNKKVVTKVVVTKAVTKSDILAALPKLPKDDLEAIVAVAQSLLGPRTEALAASNPEAATYFDALSVTLGFAVNLANMPEQTVKLFHKKMPLLTKWLGVNFKGYDSTKLKKIAVLRLMFMLLKDDLIRINIKPNFTTMINNLHRMPEVFDNAFPGYLEAGLGNVITRPLGGVYKNRSRKNSR